MAEEEDRRPRELLAERAFTRLGSARDADGAIAPEKIAEVAETVARQVRLAGELGADRVRVVATSAVRDASNGDALARAIAAACGLPVEVLTGEEEARLSFAGAIGMLREPPLGELGVVDVGGGSTELAVGTIADGVTWSVSLPLGSSVATHSDLPHDPPSVDELTRLRARIGAIFDAVQAPRPTIAYAVGGSATSLQQLVGSVLGPHALALGLQALVGHPSAEVARQLGLHAERVRLLPAGILLLDAAARTLRAPLQMGGGGLREGVVLEELRRAARA
ncbi:MAG: exopolyphosphatase / guanosine-5-triphosphate,3-diphosphate pyrophosphatase [Solirubrobacteraceae bacterium]|nr:exopolyphosphatase / guanosine-5-triphosphate,3-diphosphate pyrophosphatase [Solirubrobacteraceae bacterium]